MKKFLAILAVVAMVAFAAPAFAANPFADVPAGHWAYDAVAQLAADGLISGYPDGAFKGARQATRYEVAAMVARAVARGDELHASKQDLELLKKLVMEFKDELDAMGVKVNKLDKRVSTLEKNIGGWKISGVLKFDAKHAMGDAADNGKSQWGTSHYANEWNKDQARLFFYKQIDENTYFDSQYRIGSWASSQAAVSKSKNNDDKGNSYAYYDKSARHKGRGESFQQSWNKFYVRTMLPYGIEMKVGRWQEDFEDNAGLYTDEDATIGDWRLDGFLFKKNFGGTLLAELGVGRNSSGEIRNYLMEGSYNQQLVEANIMWTPNDKIMLGAMDYYQRGDGKFDSLHMNTAGVYGGFKFTPGIQLKGIYYWQKYSDNPANTADYDANSSGVVEKLDKDQHSWKAILDVNQSVLKFTSLWVEYAQETNGFGGNNWTNGQVARYSMLGTYNEPGVLQGRPANNETSKYWFIQAKQKWNKKWGSFLRYTHADFGTTGISNAKEMGVGITYQYTPAIGFTLGYDYIDYGDTPGYNEDNNAYKGTDNVLIFRTQVKF
jgi:hypothetical protein